MVHFYDVARKWASPLWKTSSRHWNRRTAHLLHSVSCRLTAEGFSLACEEQNEKHLSLSRGSWVISTLCRRAPRLLCVFQKTVLFLRKPGLILYLSLVLALWTKRCKSMFAWCKHSLEVQYLRFVVKFSFINSLTRVALRSNPSQERVKCLFWTAHKDLKHLLTCFRCSSKPFRCSAQTQCLCEVVHADFWIQHNAVKFTNAHKGVNHLACRWETVRKFARKHKPLWKIHK